VTAAALTPRAGRTSELAIARRPGDDVLVVHLQGQLDTYTAESLRRSLDDHDPHVTTLVLDMSEVGLVDSSGLGLLISFRNLAAAAGRRVGLVSGNPLLREVLGIAGVDEDFVHGDDVEAVLAALGEEHAHGAGHP
jgi:anti-anti-sigma factor